MKSATKKEMKETVQEALKSRYGFKPSAKEINLLEASGDRTYILFEVNNVEYRFTSRHCYLDNGFDTGVWIDPNTVERIG